MRRLWDSALRLVVLAFCWITALYAFIASSAFAYLQFIKPRVFHWLGTFADLHWIAAWVWLLALLVLLRPFRGRGRAAATGAALVATVGGFEVLLNTWLRVVPSLHDGPRSVAAGVAALLPVFGIAMLDHLAAWTFLNRQRGVSAEDERRRIDGRVFVACMGTAVMLTCGYGVLTSVSLGNSFEPDLLTAGLALGAFSTLLDHLLVFAAAFAVLAVLSRAGGRSVVRQYLLLLLGTAALFAGLFARFVGESVGLVHAPAAVAAFASGMGIAMAWGGMGLSANSRRGRVLSSGLDVFLGPPSADGNSVRHLVIALAAVLPLAWLGMLLASRMDWDFALLKSGVVCVWLLTFGLVYRATPLRDVSTLIVAGSAAMPLVVHAAWRPTELQQHTLSRYAVYNASYLMADSLLRHRVESSTFDRYLRANTGLTDVGVRPISIDPVPSPARSKAPPPHIFLFVVDSLRSDYLSPYDPGVHFTPRIAEFAAQSLSFPNAFTRYGGTGLSMPAIWAGSALAHKQYIVPFDSMNALEKLVAANGYRRIQTHDHITEALWSDLDGDIELDRGKTEMQFEFCGTLDEIGRALESGVARSHPVFAQTRSLNLHVAAVRNGYVPPGKSYPGFEAPYAYRVELIDGCFGSFVDRLKRLNLYENSIVVLTADHGELIGEDGRWGHSYHMFPQVVQVPLMIHLPETSRSTPVDRGAAALSTDITPTVYAALGLRPQASDPLAGRSLIGGGDPDSAVRRRSAFVLAASYGAVYAVVSRNGRRLYIADAIQEQDRAYERASLSDLHWSEVPVRPATRALGQLRIRRHVDTVARTYHLDRRF
jgi:hypothetical protein